MTAAFAGAHVGIAVRLSGTGLDPTGAAIAIASSGLGWTTWFATLLWLAWRGRRW